MDINGGEMDPLSMYLKRNSDMFKPKFGKAERIKTHYNKVIEMIMK
jgi:hypothetical protein